MRHSVFSDKLNIESATPLPKALGPEIDFRPSTHRRSAVSGPAWHKGLTPRESEVARLVERNFSNDEIARTLGIKLGAVKIHVHHVLIKQVDRLTARQYQVAMLVARGLTNREVASQLGLSEGTVKLQMHNILQKLGLRMRYDIIPLRSLLEENALRPLAQAKTLAVAVCPTDHDEATGALSGVADAPTPSPALLCRPSLLCQLRRGALKQVFKFAAAATLVFSALTSVAQAAAVTINFGISPALLVERNLSDAAVAALLAAGFEPVGKRGFGGRARFVKPGTPLHVTVGKVTTRFYEVVDGNTRHLVDVPTKRTRRIAFLANHSCGGAQLLGHRLFTVVGLTERAVVYADS